MFAFVAPGDGDDVDKRCPVTLDLRFNEGAEEGDHINATRTYQ